MVVGPFVISLPGLFFVLGLVAALLVAARIKRCTGRRVDKPLWWSLIAGVLVARLSFVLMHLPAFAAQPWHALYLWRGGYDPIMGTLAGLVVAGLACAPRVGRAPRTLFFPVLTGLVVWGGLVWTSHALDKATTRPLPDITLVRFDSGKPVSLADFRGRPVVVNLWATWCPPCRREMPILAAAQEAQDEIRFVFVDQREAPGKVGRYLNTENLQLNNVLLDPYGDMVIHFGVRSLPTTLFFNAQGQLVDTHIGAMTRAMLYDYLYALAPGRMQ